MSTQKTRHKDEISIFGANSHHFEQTLKRVESSVDKRFDKIEARSEKTQSKIDILFYFLVFDIVFCFLILGTMRSWF